MIKPESNQVKVGDLIRAAYGRDEVKTYHTGVVIEVKEVTDLFSEKYAIVETNTYVKILTNGSKMAFDLDEDEIEVVSESR